MEIAIVGACGKLGSQIVNECKKNPLYKVNCIDIVLGNSLCIHYDMVIDASTASQSVATAKFCEKNKIPLLIACTGHTQKQLTKIDKICQSISYCVCSNLSCGIAFVLKCLENLQILHNPYISITETHHIHKKDSPSGTAITLKNQIEKYVRFSPAISSIRQGDTIGEHSIKICLPHEEIVISHNVLDRKVFAQGAIYAIQTLSKLPPKKYDFLQLLENKL